MNTWKKCDGVSPIRAVIIDDDRCDAGGYSVRGHAPVLVMCRKLIEAGYDPATPLHAYRGGDSPCLRVSSIGYGANFTVEDSKTGTPIFRRWRDRHARDGAAPPVRQKRLAA